MEIMPWEAEYRQGESEDEEGREADERIVFRED